MAIGAMRAAREHGPAHPRRPERRRLRRHRPRRPRRSAADDGPSADPPEGRRRGPAAARGGGAARGPSTRAPPARRRGSIVRGSTGPAPPHPTGGAARPRRGPTGEVRACDDGRMPDAPAWVRDAVFYQIFPDRFAGSARVPKPGPLEPWDAPPTNYGFKGGDLLGIVEHLDHIESLGVNALYFTPVFQSASNHRYHTYDYLQVDPLLGGNDAPCASCWTRPTRGACGSCSTACSTTRPRLLAVPPRARDGRRLAVPQLVPLRRGGPRPQDAGQRLSDRAAAAPASRRRADAWRGPAPRPTPARRARGSGYEAWWGIPALPKLNIAEPAVREYLWGVAEHWLRFGIDGWRLDVPAEINDPPFWAEFRRRCRAVNPEAYLVGEIWHVAPEWLAGDRFDALMNYPLAEAIIGFVGGRSLERAAAALPPRVRPDASGSMGPGSRRRLGELLAAYAPETNAVQLNLLDSHDTPRRLLAARRRPRGDGAGGAAPGDAARRAVHLLRRRGRAHGRHRSGFAPGVPLGRVALGPRAARVGPGVVRVAPRRARAALRRRVGDPRRSGAAWRSSAAAAIGRLVVAHQRGRRGCRAPAAARGRTGRTPRHDRPRGRPGTGPTRRDRRIRRRGARRAPAALPGSSSASAERRAGRSRRRGSAAQTYTPAMSDLPVSLPAGARAGLRRGLRSARQARRGDRRPRPGRGSRRPRRSTPTAGPMLDGLRGAGARIAGGARHRAAPARGCDDGSVDAVLGLWSAFRGVDPAEIAEVDRVLRPGGRHLVVHDYGRDDVSRLFPADRPEYRDWSHRFGPFLSGGFRVRVVHCFWEFDSPEATASFLAAAFGRARRGAGADAQAPAALVQRRRLPSLPTVMDDPAHGPRPAPVRAALPPDAGACDRRAPARHRRRRSPRHAGQTSSLPGSSSA